MIITSKETGAGFEFDEREAIGISEILTPIMVELPPRERIAAMALQIAAAAWELGAEQHESLDNLSSHTMGAVVEFITRKGFKAQRREPLLDDEPQPFDEDE